MAGKLSTPQKNYSSRKTQEENLVRTTSSGAFFPPHRKDEPPPLSRRPFIFRNCLCRVFPALFGLSNTCERRRKEPKQRFYDQLSLPPPPVWVRAVLLFSLKMQTRAVKAIFSTGRKFYYALSLYARTFIMNCVVKMKKIRVFFIYTFFKEL